MLTIKDGLKVITENSCAISIPIGVRLWKEELKVNCTLPLQQSLMLQTGQVVRDEGASYINLERGLTHVTVHVVEKVTWD